MVKLLTIDESRSQCEYKKKNWFIVIQSTYNFNSFQRCIRLQHPLSLCVMFFFSFAHICQSLFIVYIYIQNDIQSSMQPNDRFYCWLNVTAIRQKTINETCVQLWLASCHQWVSNLILCFYLSFLFVDRNDPYRRE